MEDEKMKTFNQKLEDYAKLIVEIGINVQKDKPIALSAPVEVADFGRMLVKKAYEAGASDVSVTWYDDFVTRQRFENAPLREFETFPEYLVDKVRYLSLIHI